MQSNTNFQKVNTINDLTTIEEHSHSNSIICIHGALQQQSNQNEIDLDKIYQREEKEEKRSEMGHGESKELRFHQGNGLHLLSILHFHP